MSEFLLIDINLRSLGDDWKISESGNYFRARCGNNCTVQLQSSWKYPKTFIKQFPEGVVFGYINPAQLQNVECLYSWREAINFIESYSINFPTDEFLFIYCHTKSKKLILIRDIHCTLPLFLYKDKERLVIGNQFASLFKNNLHIKLDKQTLAATLAFLPSYNNKTIIDNLYKITERSSIEITEQKTLWSHWEFPKYNSKEQEFGNILEGAIKNRIKQVKDYAKIGVELSGGLDSSTVAGVSSTVVQGLPTFSIEFTGRSKATQREKIKLLQKRFSLQSTAVKIGNALPLSERKRKNSKIKFYRSDIYEAAINKLALTAKKKIDVILTGIGGDELFLIDKGEKSNFTSEEFRQTWLKKELPPFFTQKLMHELHQYLTTDKNLPLPVLPYSVHGANWATNNIFIKNRIWPIAPLADPSLVNFCRNLPKEMRIKKQILRDYQIANNYPEIIRTGVNENFQEVFRDSFYNKNRKFVTKIIRNLKLNELGYINKERLLSSYESFFTKQDEVKPVVIYGIVVIDMLIAGLQSNFNEIT